MLFMIILSLAIFGVQEIAGKCEGKTVINAVSNGTISLSDDNEKYSENTRCEWLIKAPANQFIKLEFTKFDTECSYDFLIIHDGTSTKSLILGKFSGNTLPPPLISKTSSLLLSFFSDNYSVRHGWKADFTIVNCSCDEICDHNDILCNCSSNTCTVETCPHTCNNHLGNGVCSQSTGECSCNSGYHGESCSYSSHDIPNQGSWHVIKRSSDVFKSRFSHAGVYVKETDSFWVFGGSDLNDYLDDLIKYDFFTNQWILIKSNTSAPLARCRHTLNVYKDLLILFGGELSNGSFSNELWSFNISTLSWRILPSSVIAPPGLASHTANIVNDELFIFAGNSKETVFHEMFKYDFIAQQWSNVVYKLSKNYDLRLSGHTSIYYPALHSFIIFGGLKNLHAWVTMKQNTIQMFHIKSKVWKKISNEARNDSFIAPPMAFHSSVIVGDYMVIYGGNVREPNHEEKCFGDNIFLFNLKTFQWVSPLLLKTLGSTNDASAFKPRGRFSAAISLLNNNTMLVSGGFHGRPNSDLIAYQFPINIVSGNNDVITINAGHCSLYLNMDSCQLDELCVWCRDPVKCISITEKHQCNIQMALSVLHGCRLFHQCGSCLTWGDQADFKCGWCVQDSHCYPLNSPSGACAVLTSANAHHLRGWWGKQGHFLTSFHQCRTQDTPPGFISVTSIQAYQKNYIDKVTVVNPFTTTFDPKSSFPVEIKLSGFLYPFLVPPVSNNLGIKLLISKMPASVHLSTDERPDHVEKVISFNNKDNGLLKYSNNASRTNGDLFPGAALYKPYYMYVRIQYRENENMDGILSMFMKNKLITGNHIRPFFSQQCSHYIDCLTCLSDASCGWCSSTKSCVLRNSSFTCTLSGENIHLVLNVTFCETCWQHVDCDTCLQSVNCAWDHYCIESNPFTSKVNSCPSLCSSKQNCASCVSDNNCMWCGLEQECVSRLSYLPNHTHGSCTHWSFHVTENYKCSDCVSQTTCDSCLSQSACGWCGEYHNGRCYDGGYDGPFEGECEQLMNGTNTNSSLWSYSVCPDENECITKQDCHQNATCTNFDNGYECTCLDGYEGDGKHCNISCFPVCINGECNADLSCDCDLGWTGNICSINCGCNNHSTCDTAIGVCDQCQELTHGEHCEFCISGSYGNATNVIGCTKCSCHGHGDEQRGECDSVTGHCFCMNNTMGENCDKCLPGLVGQPWLGGGCYFPCKDHSILSNITKGAISSSNGTLPRSLTNNSCVWIITTLKDTSPYVVYHQGDIKGTITLRIEHLNINCQTDHLNIYDGLPPTNLEENGSFQKLASLCGTDGHLSQSIETTTGTLVVVFNSNVYSNSFLNGFNATFVINLCPHSCFDHRSCYNEECVCKNDWSGAGCEQLICPNNCSQHLNQGYCDQNYRSCVCNGGFYGKSCELRSLESNVWRTSFIKGKNESYARMAHTMVTDDVSQTLVIYGGYSLSFGILGDILLYNILTNDITQVIVSGIKPTSRYFHASAVYQRFMYVSGGINEDGVFSSELWRFHLDLKQWSKANNLPRSLAVHTINIVADTIYIIGGYDPIHSCSSVIYTLKLDSISDWKKLKPSGDVFHPCFGHTTVYNKFSNEFMIYGRHVGQFTSSLVVLNLDENKRTILHASTDIHSRIFHSSIFLGNYTLLFGGYDIGKSAQEFAESILVYNKECNKWKVIDMRGNFPRALAFSAVSRDSSSGVIYVFGGYNGVASHHLYHLNTSFHFCSLFSTHDDCMSEPTCYWCLNQNNNKSLCYHKSHDNTDHCLLGSIQNGQCPISRQTRSITDFVPTWLDQCAQYSGDCTTCVQAIDINGQSLSCFWALDIHQCLSYYIQPFLCAFGLCGRLLSEFQECPANCNRTSYCSDCLQQYNCGWCSHPLGNGAGNCLVGTIEGPINNLQCRDVVSQTWVSSVCLIENECENGNHLCNENETCHDLQERYECHCKNGYERINDECVPICRQGCVNGHCIDPDVCSCSFGWVASNCSVYCHCHGKGQCLDEDHLNVCTNCRDNTMGSSCERCVPSFVGEDGLCTSCYEKCNKNAKQCYTTQDYAIITSSDSQNNMTSVYGPTNHEDYVCLCEDNSKGTFCETCNHGYYKLQKHLKCEKCRCRGHGNACTVTTGSDCNCKNNTQAVPICRSSAGNLNSNCHNLQCSTCDGRYTGDPDIEGQQCYRTMKILQHFSLTREDLEDSRLLPSQTNFFYINPSYKNTDIRLTLDVFVGSIDVYITASPNTFKVSPSQNISDTSDTLHHLDWYSDGLNKYSSYIDNQRAVVITDIEHRLILTFPHESHHLEDQKFYMIVKASQFDGADGIVYFKQDTSKINLVVFFVVFTCCFFLFLTVLLIGWTLKQRINSRQQVHHREAQRERLENRPFSEFIFLFEYQPPSPNISSSKKSSGSVTQRRGVRALGVQSTSDSLAAISTVMIQLPQTDKTKMSVVLGTSLTLLTSYQAEVLTETALKSEIQQETVL